MTPDPLLGMCRIDWRIFCGYYTPKILDRCLAIETEPAQLYLGLCIPFVEWGNDLLQAVMTAPISVKAGPGYLESVLLACIRFSDKTDVLFIENI